MSENIVTFEMDLDNPPPLTEGQKTRLAALAERPDSEIDFSDIPPLTDAFFDKAVPFRTLLQRRRSSRIEVELEILAWIRTQTDDPQSRINELLRIQMQAAIQKTS